MEVKIEPETAADQRRERTDDLQNPTSDRAEGSQPGGHGGISNDLGGSTPSSSFPQHRKRKRVGSDGFAQAAQGADNRPINVRLQHDIPAPDELKSGPQERTGPAPTSIPGLITKDGLKICGIRVSNSTKGPRYRLAVQRPTAGGRDGFLCSGKDIGPDAVEAYLKSEHRVTLGQAIRGEAFGAASVRKTRELHPNRRLEIDMIFMNAGADCPPRKAPSRKLRWPETWLQVRFLDPHPTQGWTEVSAMLITRSHLHSFWGKSRSDEDIYRWYLCHDMPPPAVVTSRYAEPKPSTPLGLGDQHLTLEWLQGYILQAVKQCLAQAEPDSHLPATDGGPPRTTSHAKFPKSKASGGKQFTSRIPDDNPYTGFGAWGHQDPSGIEIDKLKLQHKLQALIPELLRA